MRKDKLIRQTKWKGIKRMNKDKYIRLIYYMKKYRVTKKKDYIKALKKLENKKEKGTVT